MIIISLTLEKKTSEHHIPTIPVDAEAVSVTSQITERVQCTLNKCRDQISQLIHLQLTICYPS